MGSSGGRFKSPRYLIEFCMMYLRLWADFFRLCGEDLKERKLQIEEEEVFFQVVTILALNHFKFKELLNEYFKNPDAILEVLKESVSLSHLKAASDAQISQLLSNWHALFIEMIKCLSRLIALLPPEEQEFYRRQKVSLTL
jgi:hypothetical protein